MIVKVKDKYLVKDAEGKRVLGTHDTKAKAIAQLKAIEASKARRAKGLEDDTDQINFDFD